MKIGFDAKRIFFNETGLGNYSRTLVRLLKRYHSEEQYYLFTPPIKGTKPVQHQTQFSDFHVIEPAQTIDRILSSRWRNSLMVKDLVKHDLDIYHGLSHEIPKNIEKTNIKSVVTIHDLIFLKFPELYKPWDVITYRKKYLDSCYRADTIIAISENTKKDIMEFLQIAPEKIHVIYQSAGPDYYRAYDKAYFDYIKQLYNLSESYLLYVGSLNKRKNLNPLIKSIALLKDKSLNLVIIGSGSEKDKLERTAIEEGISQKVRFLTGVPGEHLPAIYSCARVFMYPSLYEGFGIPIMESLLCKTPVITNQGSCFSEAAGEGGLYVDVSKPEHLAEATEFLLNKENNAKFSENGFRHVQKFSEKNFANNTFNLYKNILNK